MQVPQETIDRAAIDTERFDGHRQRPSSDDGRHTLAAIGQRRHITEPSERPATREPAREPADIGFTGERRTGP
jgi:hypothetical protein